MNRSFQIIRYRRFPANPVIARRLLSATALRHHVPMVIERGAEEEMIGVAAATVVASVTDQQLARIGVVGERPRRAMREKARPAEPNRSVSVVADAISLKAPARHGGKARTKPFPGFAQPHAAQRFENGSGGFQ